jgi:MOSC domain-containing protein YiiM
MEVLERVEVSVDRGIEGDFRGRVKPGGRGKRQVTLMARRDWAAAMAELDRDIAWQERRVNLLVEGLDLPKAAGALIHIGEVTLRVMAECDPCSRMEALAPGLEAALTPDWRGGVCSKVLVGGVIAVGDKIRIEEA